MKTRQKWLGAVAGALRVLAVALLAIASGCQESDGPMAPITPTVPITTDPVLTVVEVTPASAELFATAPASTVQLTVTPKDQNGRAMTGLGAPAFSSNNALVATVDVSGKVTAVAAGTAEITASVSGAGVTKTGRVGVVVLDAPPAAAGGLEGRIAFVSDRDGTPHIYVVNADGSGLARLTNGVQAGSRPAWSPDGRRIVFARAGDAGGCGGIYTMDADGSGVTRLTAACGDGDPAWSPDGTRIAFSRAVPELGTRIHVMNADGSGVTELFDDTGARDGVVVVGDDAPAWSPDGRTIAFHRTIEDPWGDWFGQVYVMNSDGSGVRRLTSPSAGGREYAEGSPAWSPDGFMIAFWSFGFGIAIIAADGAHGGPIGIYQGDVGFSSHPDWSPDGRKIVFHTFSDRRIYIADAFGGGSGKLQPLRTGSHGGQDWDPAWSRVR